MARIRSVLYPLIAFRFDSKYPFRFGLFVLGSGPCVWYSSDTHNTALSFILMDIFRRKRYFKICGYSRIPFWCNSVWCVAKVPVLQIPFIPTDRNQVKSIYRAEIRTLLRQKHPKKYPHKSGGGGERNFSSITLLHWVSDPCFHGSTTTLSGMNARFIRCCFTGGQRGQRCSFGLQAFCGFHVHAEPLSHSWAAEMLMTVDGWTEGDAPSMNRNKPNKLQLKLLRILSFFALF